MALALPDFFISGVLTLFVMIMKLTIRKCPHVRNSFIQTEIIMDDYSRADSKMQSSIVICFLSRNRRHFTVSQDWERSTKRRLRHKQQDLCGN